MNPLKHPARVRIPRQGATDRPAALRVRDFDEVCLGLTEEAAQVEALRCLECRDPACTRGCPVGVDIRNFVRRIVDKDYHGALRTIRETNALPAICGRVCPQESQCEAGCVLGRRFAPLAIGKLERFVADQEPEALDALAPARDARRVAVVGSGPAGLTCAAELARRGHAVTVFEALHAAGGVLRYGIPAFRLPRRILDRELARIRALGVTIATNVLVGRTLSVDELLGSEGFGAVFLATGAGAPTFLGIPGEGLVGVYSANEFLTRVNLMDAWRFPEADTPVRIGREVAVVGGGNTAMDAVRVARRLGAERAYVVYRRSRQEMPARLEEVEHAVQEGVELLLLANPSRILGDAQGEVTGLECVRMELTEPDASGRRSVRPIAGSAYVIPVQTVIEAVGQRPNPIVPSTTSGLDSGPRGTLLVSETQATTRLGVFAGGDLARGGATVILAMRDGKRAAQAIHEYLKSPAGRTPPQAGLKP